MFGIAILALLAGLVIWGIIRNTQELRRKELWAEALAQAAPALLGGVYHEVTSQLHDAYPNVTFALPRPTELNQALKEASQREVEALNREYRALPHLRKSLKTPRAAARHAGAVAVVVMDNVAAAAVESYLRHRSPLSEPLDLPHAWADETFWASERSNRTTPGGRDPRDWKIRRSLVLRRDGGRCRNCGKLVALESCHIHHVKRRSEGGDHALSNLIALCRDCHTLMDGHGTMRAIRPYWISSAGTIHRKYCQHAKKARVVWGSLPKLQAQGYRPCKVCKPRMGHERKLQAWEPAITREVHEWIRSAIATRSDGPLPPDARIARSSRHI